MSTNLYSYGIHRNIGAGELFFYIALDKTREELGLDDLAAASAILLGQNDVPVGGKLAGAVAGTSVVSMAARKFLPFRVAVRLPTIVKAGAGGLRIAMTRSLGAFVGRTIPVVGTVMLGRDAFLIMKNTVATYNRMAKAEDRIL
ncbi:STM2901 family protein [Paraburkholderia sp. SIMBA_027]|uniref:STM2901 family protein n=1 Tax=Paraburkholderia sp. SIMBA_027 TaxID=3085770 RepID=UPI0039795599